MKRQTIFRNDTVIKFNKTPFMSIKTILIVILFLLLITTALKAEPITTINLPLNYNNLTDYETLTI